MARWGPCWVGRCAGEGPGCAFAHPETCRRAQDENSQPLLPGSNELDQISKIHDVTGILANKALHKFKQSRIAKFGFSFKKGKGIPPVVHSLPPKGFSLLYAMIKYDPDERIAAHQALQHPYFQELWAAETQKIKITGKYIRTSTSAFVAHFNGKSKDRSSDFLHQFNAGVHQCRLCKEFLREKLQETSSEAEIFKKELAEVVFGRAQ